MEPEREKKKTTLSQHDVARMQKVEAMYDAEEDEVNAKSEVPDMSVGWYSTPVDQDEP
ncbi:hypothetical protein [Alicyclobacillus fastidiosus]|uniref:YfhD family protein n=1 Tax=Alicyclobacillus fastidiosus TaxID=392011 RepID=A0ABV5AC77_9BACL|nr:hypothetical protein [Alicyclobacillus fastidiosus]WEH10583.1 hypothetical protein PYS47_04980 [Alicyclobacillus fastidiosus]